ncbi:hypothetical protein ES705_45564 [subsurface metagenome]
MTTASSKPLAQRKQSQPSYSKKNSLSIDTLLVRLTYGVPAPKRMLTAGVLRKKHERIRNYLVNMGLTAAERQITFELLRLYTYYGKVYPKAQEFSSTGGCSKRSFWRAVAKLEDAGVVDRINRYLHHLQISNCYRLDKLVLCIVRYLAEHGCPFLDRFTQDMLELADDAFWKTIWRLRVRLRDPKPITIMA